MNIYDWTEIKLTISCEEYLNRAGIQVRNHRCKAVWRGGTHDSVSVDGAVWCDHADWASGTSAGTARKDGGSVIDLCAINQFNGDMNAAASWLGENFGLTPKFTTKAAPKLSPVDAMIKAGWKVVARYDYTDDKGNLRYMVTRLEKDEDGERKKTFVQTTPNSDNIEGVHRLPYNLTAVVESDEVYIVEGEKDVETLRSHGIVATCNSGGACNWHPSLNKWMAGKDVVILPDNDEKGREHARMLTDALKPIAKSLKVVTLSNIPKGDVTDWIEKEGGTSAMLRELVAKANEVDAELPPDRAIAKQANMTPFCNYVMVSSGKKKSELSPVGINELIKECHLRTMNYPRLVGTVPFDWDLERKCVLFLHNSDELFAWLGRITGKIVDWFGGQGFVTQKQFYCGLAQAAIRYESICSTPHFPPRKDVYYTFGKLPPPDPTHESFWKFVDFFNPCNRTNRTALAAFFLAPMFYEYGSDRPMWVIDTIDQQGSGKSSVVQMCAELYNSLPLPCDLQLLERDPQQFRRRLVSASARSSRISQIDNLVGTAASPNLAALVTDAVISAIAPYGRQEESRPNDITFAITVNNADMNTDLASRAYTASIANPKNPDPNWKSIVIAYIRERRMQMYSDMFHMMETNPLRDLRRRKSRFGAFDRMVLSAVCRNEEEFRALDRSLSNENDKANRDDEMGADFLDLFTDRMVNIRDPKPRETMTTDELAKLVDFAKPIFIRSQDVDWIVSNSDGALKKLHFRDIQGLVRNGLVKCFDRRRDRLQACTCLSGEPCPQYRGLLYVPPRITAQKIEVQVIKRNGSSWEVVALTNMVRSGVDMDRVADAINAEVGSIPAPAPTPAVPAEPAAPASTGEDMVDDVINSL